MKGDALTVVPSPGEQTVISDKEGAGFVDVAENENGIGKQELKSGLGIGKLSGLTYAATFLTQLQVLSGREWKILKR
jgi:hypothetical protein